MKNKKLLIAIILPIILFATLLTFDLVSKYLIVEKLGTVGTSIVVIKGFISFIYVKNTGAAWGVLSGRPIFLIVVSIIVISLFIFFYVLRVKNLKGNISFWLIISVGFITGGCFGNLIDRIALGYVRDFINFDFINFPVFNVADICLTIGIILLLIYFIFFYNKEDNNKTKNDLLTTEIENNNNNDIKDNNSENQKYDNKNNNIETNINTKDILNEDEKDNN